jgi:hypothetical protein
LRETADLWIRVKHVVSAILYTTNVRRMKKREEKRK